MTVVRTEKNVEREFIGRAWINTVKNSKSEYKGVEYINVVLDQDVAQVSIKNGDKIQLWPNTKREGKQDADYRVSLLTEGEQA